MHEGTAVDVAVAAEGDAVVAAAAVDVVQHEPRPGHLVLRIRRQRGRQLYGG